MGVIHGSKYHRKIIELMLRQHHVDSSDALIDILAQRPDLQDQIDTLAKSFKWHWDNYQSGKQAHAGESSPALLKPGEAIDIEAEEIAKDAAVQAIGEQPQNDDKPESQPDLSNAFDVPSDASADDGSAQDNPDNTAAVQSDAGAVDADQVVDPSPPDDPAKPEITTKADGASTDAQVDVAQAGKTEKVMGERQTEAVTESQTGSAMPGDASPAEMKTLDSTTSADEPDSSDTMNTETAEPHGRLSETNSAEAVSDNEPADAGSDTQAIAADAEAATKKPVAGDPPNPAQIVPSAPPSTPHAVSKAPNKEPIMQKPVVRFRLNNATVGREYKSQLDCKTDRSIRVYNVKGLTELGLVLDPHTRTISGNPTKAGEFDIQVHYCLSENSQANWRQSFRMIINADPNSLWKDLDSDREAPFWKEDNVCSGQRCESGWLMAAASRRGRSHAHEGKFRDDDYAMAYETGSGWHVLAVSDGAGSANFSREGSRLAVNIACTVLTAKLSEIDKELCEAFSRWDSQSNEESTAALKNKVYSAYKDAIYKPIEAIHTKAKELQCEFRDFYATLLVAAHKQVDGKNFVTGYWIGDGALAIYDKGKAIKLLGESDSGAFAGQTRFLDRNAALPEDMMARIRFESLDSMTALMLMTDGVSDPLFETENQLKNQQCWDDFWNLHLSPNLSDNPQQTAENMLAWLNFLQPGHHDDRTQAILYRSEALNNE